MVAGTKKILFYYLSAFSHTGGIEKFNRCFIKALSELAATGLETSVVSAYDAGSDDRYNPNLAFRGFAKKRGASLLHVIRQGLNKDVLVLGHINLAVAGVVVKLLRPSLKLIVVAHGIEVWKPLHFFKRWCLRLADTVLSVSNYTKNQLVLRNGLSPSRILIFPNTIDPLFNIPAKFTRPSYLMERYGIKSDNRVILTLSRLSSSEQEKGYDKVIAAMPGIIRQVPGAVYILAGKYDEMEKARISRLLEQYQVKEKVILTGFVEEKEVVDHYRLADVFIMPSRKEGFGIVFLEALACGTPVIGGNQDGTVDALRNGALGLLINPRNIHEITTAITGELGRNGNQQEALQRIVLDQYQFSRYKDRLETSLS